MISSKEKQRIVAEAELARASKVLYGWYKHMLKEKSFTLEDMSEPELEFMEAVKDLRKAERAK
jgi:hypothetical protein